MHTQSTRTHTAHIHTYTYTHLYLYLYKYRIIQIYVYNGHRHAFPSGLSFTHLMLISHLLEAPTSQACWRPPRPPLAVADPTTGHQQCATCHCLVAAPQAGGGAAGRGAAAVGIAEWEEGRGLRRLAHSVLILGVTATYPGREVDRICSGGSAVEGAREEAV